MGKVENSLYRLDAIHQIAESIPAATLASSPVVTFEPGRRLRELWPIVRPEASDLDHVLVESSGSEVLVARRDPNWGDCDEPLGVRATPVPAPLLLDAAKPIRAALKALSDAGFCLLVEGRRATGIITSSDLAKPAASLFAFALIQSLEAALTRLVPSLSNGRWLEMLGDERRAALVAEIDERKQKGTWLCDEECLTLSDKLTLGGKLVSGELGISRTAWRKTGGLVQLRNDLAHGRSLLARYAPRTALEKLVYIEDLAERAWRCLDEGQHVWDAYAATECYVHLGKTLTRLEAVRVQLPEVFWMVSAQNPCELRLAEETNQRQHQALVETVRGRGQYVAEGKGAAPAEGSKLPGWSEDMVLMGGDRASAVDVSRLHGQRSLFEFEGTTMRVIEVETAEIRRERRLLAPES